MLVSAIEQEVTNVTGGGKAAQAMTAAATAEFFHILSSNLYSDPSYAAIRETICNAWDAHIAAGITDTPIKISYKDDTIIIQDFGYGIDHDKIQEIYGVYGGSTKRSESKQTGGFGLGCKSPFAVADTFTVRDCYEGTMVLYSMQKHCEEVGGLPGIKEMVRVPTTERGMTVTIPTTNIRDFRNHVKRVVQMGGIHAVINGTKTYKGDPEDQKWKAIQANSIYGHSSGITDRTILVRYGSVVYPIWWQNKYAQLISQMRLCFVVTAEPDSLGVTPSREKLAASPESQEYLDELIETCWLEFVARMKQPINEKMLHNFIGRFTTKTDVVSYLFGTDFSRHLGQTHNVSTLMFNDEYAHNDYAILSTDEHFMFYGNFIFNPLAYKKPPKGIFAFRSFWKKWAKGSKYEALINGVIKVGLSQTLYKIQDGLKRACKKYAKDEEFNTRTEHYRAWIAKEQRRNPAMTMDWDYTRQYAVIGYTLRDVNTAGPNQIHIKVERNTDHAEKIEKIFERYGISSILRDSYETSVRKKRATLEEGTTAAMKLKKHGYRSLLNKSFDTQQISKIHWVKEPKYWVGIISDGIMDANGVTDSELIPLHIQGQTAVVRSPAERAAMRRQTEIPHIKEYFRLLERDLTTRYQLWWLRCSSYWAEQIKPWLKQSRYRELYSMPDWWLDHSECQKIAMYVSQVANGHPDGAFTRWSSYGGSRDYDAVHELINRLEEFCAIVDLGDGSEPPEAQEAVNQAIEVLLTRMK